MPQEIVDCYQYVIDHMEIWFIRLNKSGFLPMLCEYFFMHASQGRKRYAWRKKLDGYYTKNPRRNILKPSTQQVLCSHLKKVRRRPAIRTNCWGSNDEHISEVLLWANTYGSVCVDRPARTYIRSVRTLCIIWCSEWWMTA